MRVLDWIIANPVMTLVILVILIAISVLIYINRKDVILKSALYIVAKVEEEWGSDMGKVKFAEAFKIQEAEQDPFRGKAVVQPHGNKFMVQNKPEPPLNREELDEHELSKDNIINAEKAYLELALYDNFIKIDCVKDDMIRNIDEINEELINEVLKYIN